jgi:hypothetical protein
MTDTVREQIIQAFIARVEPLSGLPVERAQRSWGETTDRFISVWDGADTKIDETYGFERMSFEIAVEIIWQATDNESIEANALMGEIDSTIRNADRTWNSLAVKTDRARMAPQYTEDGSRYTRVTAVYNIQYQTPIGDPYTVASF